MPLQKLPLEPVHSLLLMIVPLGFAGFSKPLGKRPGYARSRQLQWQLPCAARVQFGHQPLVIGDLVGAQSARVGVRPRLACRRTRQSRHTGFGRVNTDGTMQHPPRMPPIHSLATDFAREDEDTVQVCMPSVDTSLDHKSLTSGTYSRCCLFTHAHAARRPSDTTVVMRTYLDSQVRASH